MMQRSASARIELVFLLLLVGCAPMQRAQPRLAVSSLGCMRAAVRDYVPADGNDKLQHCLAAAFIARRCSLGEARLASWGKEFADIFDGGDPSVQDLHADYAGLNCAKIAEDEAVKRCCGAGR